MRKSIIGSCLIALSLSLTLGASAASPAHRPTQAQLRRHHAARVHAAHVHHARMVQAARLRAQAIEIEHINALLGGVGSWRDWVTTDTASWRCIRLYEEGMQQAPRNVFGFVPFNGPMSMKAQSSLALSILHNYGWQAWSTAGACLL
jgi:hypothetical protein